mmetsp:Transcript_39650/g.89429  ORF Transcript_39650/g.89429 Transcript_39650/m.89429 type:complete len:275 (+) Transcript_39650:61-885(+)
MEMQQGTGLRHSAWGRDAQACSLVDVVRLDLPREVIAGRRAKGQVDEEQAVVDRCDHERPPHEDHAREGEGGRHGQADVVCWPVVVQEVVHGEHPLEVGRPEVDVEGPGGVRGELREHAVASHERLLEWLAHHHGASDHCSHCSQGTTNGRNLRRGCRGLRPRLVLSPAAQLIELCADVARVARSQDVVPRLDCPCKAHKEATVDHLGRGHPLVDYLGPLHRSVVHSRPCQTPVGHRAPEVRRHGTCRGGQKCRHLAFQTLPRVPPVHSSCWPG